MDPRGTMEEEREGGKEGGKGRRARNPAHQLTLLILQPTNRNLHSGIDGGAVVEPLNDLGKKPPHTNPSQPLFLLHSPSLPPSLPPSSIVGILATLVDARGMVLVPDFYAEVEVRLEGGREGGRETGGLASCTDACSFIYS